MTHPASVSAPPAVPQSIATSSPEALLSSPEALLPAELCFAGETDRRTGDRVRLHLKASLVPLNATPSLNCTSDNISEGGIHVTAPIGFGVAVGQRYELLLSDAEASSSSQESRSLGAPQVESLLSQSRRYVTVVRTKMRVSGKEDYVGVGLRFDQPMLM